ncbi:MAG: iron transporter, partial [Peptidiphaga gingivicola]
NDLQESGLIPGHGHTVYDFTETIANHASSWWFSLFDAFFQLKVLMGPTLLQILGWAVYLLVCLPLFTRQVRGKSSVSNQVRNNNA